MQEDVISTPLVTIKVAARSFILWKSLQFWGRCQATTFLLDRIWVSWQQIDLKPGFCHPYSWQMVPYRRQWLIPFIVKINFCRWSFVFHMAHAMPWEIMRLLLNNKSGVLSTCPMASEKAFPAYVLQLFSTTRRARNEGSLIFEWKMKFSYHDLAPKAGALKRNFQKSQGRVLLCSMYMAMDFVIHGLVFFPLAY